MTGIARFFAQRGDEIRWAPLEHDMAGRRDLHAAGDRLIGVPLGIPGGPQRPWLSKTDPRLLQTLLKPFRSLALLGFLASGSLARRARLARIPPSPL